MIEHLATFPVPCHFDRMEPVQLLLLAAGVVAVIVVLWLVLAKARREPVLPYTKRKGLLTAGEVRFYGVLRRAVPPGMTLFVKVRLMDVVTVADDAWATYGAPASGMHLDFVLADASTTEPVLVVELDDKSHATPKARQRDAFKDAALASAGVPLLRVAAAGRYDAAELMKRIRAALSAQ